MIEKISILQRKAVRIMTFSDFKAHSEPLFKELTILKVKDNIFLQNCLFVYDYFHGNLPKSFHNTFNKAEDLHSHFTRNARDGSLASKVYNSTKYGINSIYKLCNIDWNKITKEQKKIDDDKTTGSVIIRPHPEKT